MKRQLAHCALIATLTMPAVVSAQETGTLIRRPAAQITDFGKNAARLTMGQFAECLVKRQPVRVARYLELPVDTDEAKREHSYLFDRIGDECLSGGTLSFGSTVFRGVLAQASYIRTYRRESQPSIAATLETAYSTRYAQPLSSHARAAIGLQRFGECVARADVANVHHLVFAIAGSREESDTFGALAPRFAGCVIANEKIEFSKSVLKGVLAESIWRMRQMSEGANQ